MVASCKLPAKKGDTSVCSNYRGIALLNTIHKIVCALLYNRLYNSVCSIVVFVIITEELHC